MTPGKIKSIIEFSLLTAGEPLGMANLKRLLADDAEESVILAALAELENDWEERAMRLAKVASGYQFVSRSGYVDYLRRLQPQKNTRLSRPLLEVLAVITYQQPVTRGDVERVRGVAVSSVQIAALEELGWIEEVGRRETPGRPILYCTTKTFLNDLAVASLDALPSLSPDDADTAALADIENDDGILTESSAHALKKNNVNIR
jgi:segregation and condensation protein B